MSNQVHHTDVDGESESRKRIISVDNREMVFVAEEKGSSPLLTSPSHSTNLKIVPINSLNLKTDSSFQELKRQDDKSPDFIN